MPNQFFSPEGDIENSFVSEYWLIDQYIGDQLWAWGNTNVTANVSKPNVLFTGTNWKQVSAGYDCTAAIKTDGTLWMWGSASQGQLGTNDITPWRSTPVTTFAGGTDWKQVFVCPFSSRRVCGAIKTDGTLWVWGNGGDGQLGIPPETIGTIRSTPITTFAGGNNWKQASFGSSSSAAIKSDGSLWTWGNPGNMNTGSSLGRFSAWGGSVTPATTFAGGTNWADTATGAPEELYTLSMGSNFSAAIKTDGTLWTWGQASYATLGTNDITPNRSTPVTTFAGGTDWKQVGGGSIQMIAAIKTDGTLWTWGRNFNGSLGTNDTTPNRSTPVTTFAGGTDWKQVSGPDHHVAAIKTDGTLWTWGRNYNGSLGTNDITPNRSTPVTTFVGGTDWKYVNVGGNVTAAIKTDGTLWTWGNSSLSLLRPGTLRFRYTPVTTFAGGTNWADTATGAPEELYTLSTSFNFSAAIKTDGTLWTWGAGSFGNLGTNDTTHRSTPVTTFAGGTNWRQVSVHSTNAGGNAAAAIKTDGTLWVWGFGRYGRLGNANGGFSAPSATTPVTTFAGGTDWKQVSCGYWGKKAIKTDGTLWVWGSGSQGSLGNGTTSGSVSTPITTFAGGTNWKQVSGGNSVSAAVKTDGTLWVWGRESNGGLGNNIVSNNLISTPITTFAGGTNWTQVSASSQNTVFAVKTDGTLWSWGNNTYGQLGTNDTIQRSTPVTTFAGGTNWKQVASGHSVTAAVKTDGTLWTWGAGGFGSLGSSNLLSSLTPITTFAGGTNWKQVSADVYTTSGNILALKDDGVNKELYVIGGANFGSLADVASTPAPVTGSTDWSQVVIGSSSAVGIKTDGTLWTWGNHASSASSTEGSLLGNGNFSPTLTPVTTFAGGTNWKQATIGSPNMVAAVKTDGTLWVWGNGIQSGRLGLGYDQTSKSTPVTIFAGGTNWKQVNSGGNACMALRDDGVNKELYTWGSNFVSSTMTGILGYPSVDGYVPGEIFGLSKNWKQVSLGSAIGSAIKTDGTMWFWGQSSFGQIPVNDPNQRIMTPVTSFAGGNDWRQVSNPGSLSGGAAVKTDGTLWVWGYNQRSVGIVETKSTPVTTFAGGNNWKQVVVMSSTHGGAIKTDGTLWMWGSAGGGQMGTNSISATTSTPITTFAGGNNWKQLSASTSSSGGVFAVTSGISPDLPLS